MANASAIVAIFLVSCFLQAGARTVDNFSPSSSCIDDCNGHGKCEQVNGTNSCVCEDDWGGVSCSYPNYDLPSDHSVSVTISKDDYFYFTITNQDPPKNNMTVIVLGFTRNSTALGPSLYLSYGYFPNNTHFDFMNDSIALRKRMVTLHPKAGVWRLAVVGVDPVPLILTVQVNLDDIHNSSSCSDGQLERVINGRSRCVCSSSGRGQCDEYAKTIMNGIVYKGLITKERLWNYYHHGNEKATPLKTTVTVNGGLVVPDIYAFCDSCLKENEETRVLCKQISPPNDTDGKSQLCTINCTGPFYLGVTSNGGNIPGPYSILFHY